MWTPSSAVRTLDGSGSALSGWRPLKVLGTAWKRLRGTMGWESRDDGRGRGRMRRVEEEGRSRDRIRVASITLDAELVGAWGLGGGGVRYWGSQWICIGMLGGGFKTNGEDALCSSGTQGYGVSIKVGGK